MVAKLMRGMPASPGVALGSAWRIEPTLSPVSSSIGDQDKVEGTSPRVSPLAEREGENEKARGALAAAADELLALADDLDPSTAAIVETGALIGQDPALAVRVRELIVEDGRSAAEAISLAGDEYANAIAAVGDAMLAARADDVRSLARRAARLAVGGTFPPSGSDLVVIADDLGPGDVAELAAVLVGIVLRGGGPTAHAAIVARSLGIPMITGLASAIDEISDQSLLVVDGSTGDVTIRPTERQALEAEALMRARRAAADRAAEQRDTPAVSTDGVQISVLANVAGPEELALALRAGAEGIGLLRTELAFLEAPNWPTELEHKRMLEPILAGLGPRSALIRVLDFGADKAPPFLRSVRERGIQLLLEHEDAFSAQLRAILIVAQSHHVRVLLPMVDTPEQIIAATHLLAREAALLGMDHIPSVGAMIETPLAAANAAGIAAAAGFLSIGTNDLTAAVLGEDRFAANRARAYHPLVLQAIADAVTAAHAAEIPIEVCGEAGSDPVMVPLLVGLGIDELSVGAARVGTVREWVRRLNASECADLAQLALDMADAGEVERAISGLAGRLAADWSDAAASGTAFAP